MSTAVTPKRLNDPSGSGASRGSGERSPRKYTTRRLLLGQGTSDGVVTFDLVIIIGFILLVILQLFLVPACSSRRVQVAEEGSEDENASKERQELISSQIVSKAVEPHDDARCGRDCSYIEEGSSETDPSADSPSEATGEDTTDDHSDASDGSSASSPRHTCHICLEPLRAGEITAWSRSGVCRHAFHRDCVAEWLERQDSCPCCRAPWVVSSRGGGVKDGEYGNSSGEAAIGTDKGSQNDAYGDGRKDDELGMSMDGAFGHSFCVVHGIVPGRGGIRDQLEGPPLCIRLSDQ